MEIYGTNQNLVGKTYRGDANTVAIEIPRSMVAVGNSVDIIVRPSAGICWKVTHDFTTDSRITKNPAAMTKVGTDSNTMKWSVTSNVIGFTYQNADGADVATDSLIAVVYHRNFTQI